MEKFDFIFNPLTHWCLAKSKNVTVEHFRKVKACLMLWSATSVFMIAYVFLSYFGFGQFNAYKGGIFFTLIHCISPILFRLNFSIPVIGVVISFSGLAWQFWFCYYSGGIFSPAAVWFTIHPVILGFFGNTRLVFVSVLINVAVILGLYNLEVNGYLPDNQLGKTFADYMIMTTFIGLDILIAAFTLMAVSMNKRQNEEIREAKDHIENLIKILSHDISNPLTVMKIILDSTESGSKQVDEKALRLLRNAYNDVEEITTNVKEWMATSSYQFANIDDDMNFEILKEHIEVTFSERALSKHVNLYFSNEASITKFKTNKMILLNNIINNIVSNALKFSYPEKSIYIKMHGNSKNLYIEVIDEGVGIPEETLDSIFDPALKTTTKGTGDEAGTGFGLPIAKKMIKQINGDLILESRVFQEGTRKFGTKATVKLVSM